VKAVGRPQKVNKRLKSTVEKVAENARAKKRFAQKRKRENSVQRSRSVSQGRKGRSKSRDRSLRGHVKRRVKVSPRE